MGSPSSAAPPPGRIRAACNPATSSRARAGCCWTAGPECSRGCASASPGPASTPSRSRTSTSTTGATSCRGRSARCSEPGKGPAARLWLPPGGLETLRSFGEPLAFGAMIEEVFRIREYEDATPFTVGGLTITPVRLHRFEVATFGLRVSDGTRTLAYSGDTAPSPALAKLASGADLFLCEATLAEPEQPSTAEDGDRGHMTAGEAVAAFHEFGPRRLLVIHRPDELPLDDGIERAYDGLGLTVSNGGSGGMVLVDGVRWAVRGKDVGSVRSQRLRARLRTRHRAV